MKAPNRYRTIWISDIHLGMKACKAPFLLDFLRHNESEVLYLVGDVFDGWALARSWHWAQSHNDVIQKLLRKARKGTRVVYLPGNHDEFARDYVDLNFGEVEIKSEVIHVTADGRKLVVLHGDNFDGMIRHARWLSLLGAKVYRGLLSLNRLVNFVRRLCGLPYWSLAGFLKHKTKRAVQFIADFETVMAKLARSLDADGVVCGHIHHAEIRRIGRIEYANCGDWVESCTALVEHFDGTLELIEWTKIDHPPRRMKAKIRRGDGQSTRIPAFSVRLPHADTAR
jgi:UDP-2,3-diacylglucosamine pyrophosphatase LpxH